MAKSFNGDVLARLWVQFEKLYPTEEDCIEELYNISKSERRLKCKKCGMRRYRRTYGERVLTCTVCRRQVSFTTGTLFERVRRTRPWLAAIWLMDHGLLVSSSRFHQLVGIAQSSALMIFRKISAVIAVHLNVDESVPSGLFSVLFSKRSRETPANAHPRAEQDMIEQKCAESWSVIQEGADVSSVQQRQGDSQDPGSLNARLKVAVEASPSKVPIDSDLGGLQSVELKVLSYLSESPLHVDSLLEISQMPVSELSATLTMLELAGAAVRRPGDWYVLRKRAFADTSDGNRTGEFYPSKEVRRNVEACIESVRDNFHGISRKYLQSYLATHWCQVDRVRWSGGRLLDACLRAMPVSSAQILAYVTPLLVRLVLVG